MSFTPTNNKKRSNLNNIINNNNNNQIRNLPIQHENPMNALLNSEENENQIEHENNMQQNLLTNINELQNNNNNSDDNSKIKTPSQNLNFNEDTERKKFYGNNYNNNIENTSKHPQFNIQDNFSPDNNIPLGSIGNENNKNNNNNNNLAEDCNNNDKTLNSQAQEENFTNVRFEDIMKKMNKNIEYYSKMGLWKNALFYAEKVFDFTLKKEEEIYNIMNPPIEHKFPDKFKIFEDCSKSPFYVPDYEAPWGSGFIHHYSDELYNFAMCLFRNNEPYRCKNLIEKFEMRQYNMKFLILYGQALYECGEYENIVEVLDDDDMVFIEDSKIIFCLFKNFYFLILLYFFLV